jgi:hypothetical protein
MTYDKGGWLKEGLYTGRRIPWWPNEGGGVVYALTLGDGRTVPVPTMLVEGYNHCVPGYKVEVIKDPLQVAVEWIEKLIWKKVIWPWRFREEQYQRRVAAYYHDFYYRTNPYYKRKVDTERQVETLVSVVGMPREEADKLTLEETYEVFRLYYKSKEKK